ncbi:MAG TPA: polyprenol phosphomannose-dependent alpha 1,6 mannosyltransferase MptB, partial [Acidimicrobiales bacterium]|nr:polyprenol phosphomannose-dependent alpha 1,6 mannosyltransferase MptB [Acidimicrobiales bacterium]
MRVLSFLGRPDPGSEDLEPYVTGETRLFGELIRPTLLGFVASLAIFIGASQKDSPFTVHLPGAWILGVPAHPQAVQTPPGQWLFLGVIAVYGGMLLMLRAWVDLARVVTRHPGIPVRLFVPVFIAWIAPLLVVAPLFSKDAYSYAAQGELMSHHINPYAYGPQLLNGTPFQFLTDQLWANVPSPYGPVFLTLDGWLVQLTGHNALLSIEALRLLAVAGTAMFAAAIPVVARSFGRDGASAFVLAALNPLVLLNFVGGAHNDALMLGFLVAGYALARRGHPIIGIVFCACGSMVKITALLGVLYIGWEWLGTHRSTRERLRPLASAFIISGVVMAVTTHFAHIGWGWVKGLSNPDTVRSWIDPATGVALLVTKIVSLVGLGNHAHVLISVCRAGGLLLAAAITLWLLIHSGQIGHLRALGFSLLALVVFSPVIQPWYL